LVRRNHLDLGPRGLVLVVSSSGRCHGLTRIILSRSCRSRSEYVRRNPLSGVALVFLAVHLGPARSTPSSSSFEGGWPRKRVQSYTPQRRCSDGSCFVRLRGTTGSLRLWVPTTPTNPRSRGRLVPPCGVTPTGRNCLSRLRSCRGSASLISCRIVHGHPPFRGFSPFVAARPSRIVPSSLPFPTLRCRGSEDLSCPAPREPCGPPCRS
jgi:hypothetical protein